MSYKYYINDEVSWQSENSNIREGYIVGWIDELPDIVMIKPYDSSEIVLIREEDLLS